MENRLALKAFVPISPQEISAEILLGQVPGCQPFFRLFRREQIAPVAKLLGHGLKEVAIRFEVTLVCQRITSQFVEQPVPRALQLAAKPSRVHYVPDRERSEER